ncbi:MAG: hypothetical protein JST00_33105 [Deltaproteobacteria bacterium]|nr:hypothetical protein [Deltaproteobacteria bacterium]
MQNVERCTVVRRCSSTGLACRPDDRACTSEANNRGLQVICEDAEQTMVFCPPDTARSDSNVVWILLAAALLLAVAGGSVAWVVLRKKE